MNRLLGWFALTTAASLLGFAPIQDARGFDRAPDRMAADHAPAQPSALMRALIGEYGVGEELITVYEADGRLHANGKDLDHVMLSQVGSLEFTVADSAARFAFHLDAGGNCTAVSFNGMEWPRRDVGAEAIEAIRSGLKADPTVLRAEALAASPPIEPTPKRPMDLVALASIDPSIKFDIRYATTNNFMGFPLYEQPDAFLQRPAAQALGRAAKALRAEGYGILVYDGYRPWFVTRMFWDATPPQSRIFVADPAQGSRHNRGCAVDLTLYVLATGEPADMTSRYDEMSRRAYSDYVGGTSRQRWLRDLLRRTMERAGFTVYPEEWWHFDYNGWQDYGIGNETFAQLRKSEQMDAGLFQDMQWRNIGPFIAGKVDSVSGVSGRPEIAYVGTDNGGVWKTVNAGTTWFPLTDDVPAVRGFTALAVAQSKPSVLYAGTGSVFGSDYGNGVWKSIDAGAHWQSVGLQNAGAIAWLLVDPQNPDLVLAATRGVDHRQGGARGVFRSTDGGQSWTLVLNAQPESGATYLSWASDEPRVIFAAVTQTYLAPGVASRSLFEHPRPTSLYRSSDEGVTWAKANGRDQPALRGAVAIAVGTHAQRVYLLDHAGLYRSDDGGASWSLATKDIYTSSKQVLVDPRDPDLVYTMGTCLYRSTDGGHTLVAFKGAPGGDDPNQSWIDFSNPNHIVYGGDQGASISLDAGQTWSTWYNQKTAEIEKITTDNRYPYWIYGSKQDSGTFAIASRGALGQITDLDWFPMPGWETGFVTIDPAHPDVIFENGPLGFLQKVNRKTWGAQIVDFGVGTISRVTDTDFRRAVSAPIVFSPQHPSVLYYGTQNVWESQDGGDHWRKISPDLTAHPGKPPLPNPQGVHHGDALVALSASTVQSGVLWTGSNNGVIYVTQDGGKQWLDVTPPGMSIHGVIDVRASHFDPSSAYAAVRNDAIGDYSPHIYRTRDFGKSWQEIVAGLPTDEPTGSFVRVLQESDHKRGLLFAGTETSVQVSFDDGDHWQALRLNLPTTSFYDLQIHDGDLIAATYGRGLWILDDISPLEQLTAELADQPVILFRPRTAIRVQSNVNQDTPFPPEVPHGQNPPRGVVIDYYLRHSAQQVLLQIFDAQGNLVHSQSNASIKPLDQPPPPAPAFWARPSLPLPATAGEHRVSWDMRYPAPPALFFDQSSGAVPGDTSFIPEGPMALPGEYQVKLSVDGVSFTQPVLLEEDPRLDQSPAAMDGMRRQLALSQRIIAVMSASKNAYARASALDTNLSSQRTGVSSGFVKALRKRIAELNGTIEDASIGLSGGSYAVPPVKGQTSFSRINGQASALLEMVESTSDGAPVPSLYSTYTDLCRDFNATSGAWQSLQAQVEANAGLKHADDGLGTDSAQVNANSIQSCELGSPSPSN